MGGPPQKRPRNLEISELCPKGASPQRSDGHLGEAEGVDQTFRNFFHGCLLRFAWFQRPKLGTLRCRRGGRHPLHQGSQFAEATAPEASQRNPYVFFISAKLPPLTYPLIIEPSRLQSCGGYIPPHLTVSAYSKPVIVRASPSAEKGNNRESAFETHSDRLRRQRDADRHNDTRAVVRAPLRRPRRHAGSGSATSTRLNAGPTASPTTN